MGVEANSKIYSMRFIKLGLISLVVLFTVIFLLSLLIPSHVRVSRAVDINGNEDSIINQLIDMRQWKNWNTMVNDTAITNQDYDYKTFRSDKLQIELRKTKADTILTVWRQSGGREFVSGFTWHTSSGTTVVQWYFDFYLKWYPWEKFGSIIYDKQLGPAMERSLAGLKQRVEKMP